MRNTLLRKTFAILVSCYLTLSVFALPNESSINIDPGPPQIGCLGDLITLGNSPLATGGTAPYEITWYILGDTSDHTGLSNPYIEQPTFTLAADVIYGVLVEDALGEVCTSQVKVHLTTADAGPDVSYCTGGFPVKIGGEVIPDPDVTFTWQLLGGAPATGLDNPNIARPFASPSSTTTYEVFAQHFNGCWTADQVTVTVETNTADAGSDLNACLGASISIGNPGNPLTYTYSWSDPNGFISDLNAPNPDLEATYVPVTNPYDVYLTAISPSGCIKLDTVEVTILEAPDLSNRKIEYCEPSVRVGEDITDTPGNTYAWSVTGSPGNTTNISLPASRDPLILATGNFTVTVTNSGGCSNTMDISVITTCDSSPGDCVVEQGICLAQGDSVFIGINTDEASGFSWTPTSDLHNPASSETWASPSFSTDYVLTVDYPTYSCEYIFHVDIAPFSASGDDEILCQNESLTIGANGIPGWNYMWFPSDNLSDPNIPRPDHTATTETGLFTYIVSGTNVNSACVIKDTIIIEVVDDNADAGPDSDYCSGSSIIIGSPAKPNTTYNWTGIGLNDNTIAQPTATPSGTVMYTVNTTNNITGCTDSDDITLTEIPDISADAGGPTITICTDGNAELGGVDMSAMGYTYSWSPSIGLSDTDVANPIASPTATTTYTLTVQSQGIGCFDIDTIQILIDPNIAPTADAGPDQFDCEGMSVTIGTPAVGGITYLWVPASGLSSASAAQPTATIGSEPQLYTLRIEDTGGCFSYDQVLVSPEKPIMDAGADQVICPGDSVQLGESPQAGFLYLWTPGTGLSNVGISNPKASPSSSQPYVLTKTDINTTCFSEDSVEVTVLNLPSNDAGLDQVICETPITIGPAVSDPNYTYSWTPTTGLSNPSVYNPTVLPNEVQTETIYTLNITDNITGCSSQDMVTITPEVVNQLYSNSVGICSGGETIGLDNLANHTYSWSPALGLSSTTISNPTALPPSTTTYTVTITNTITGCSKTAQAEVVVENIPSWDLDQAVVCNTENTVIGITNNDIANQFNNWVWTPGTDLSQTDVPAPTLNNPQITRSYIVEANHIATGCLVRDTLTVNVTDDNGIAADAGIDRVICSNSTTLLGSAAVAGLNYSWSPIESINDHTLAEPTVSPSTTTTYTLVVTDPLTNCSTIDQVVVTIDDFGIDAGEDIVACKNATIALPGVDLGSGYTYEWSPSHGMGDPTIATPTVTMTSPTTFTLIVTETATSCTATDQIFVDVHTDEAPSQAAGIDQSICNGESILLGPQDDGSSSYTWTPTAGLDNPTIANPNASPSTSTTYQLTIHTGNCISQSTVVVSVADDFTADAGLDQTICNGESVSIGASDVPGLTYSWTPTTGLNDPTISNPTANPINSTVYTVNVEDAAGCTKSDQVIITVNTQPTSIAGSNISICNDGEQVQIGSNPQSGISYAWSPSTGLTSETIANPIANPSSTTTYTLTTTDDLTGCSNTNMITVSVMNCGFVCPTIDSLILSETEICSSETLDASIYRSQNIDHLALYYNLATDGVLTAADIYNGTATAIDNDIPVNQSIVINELIYWGGDTLELWNTGADTVDISSWWVCSRFTYAELSTLNVVSGDLNVEPGDYVVITGFAFDDDSADVGLYSTNTFTSPSAMIDFIQYGEAGIGRQSVAVTKGIWTSGEFIPYVGSIGRSISYDGSGDSPADWAVNETTTYSTDNVNKSDNFQTPYSGINLPVNNTSSPISYNIYAALGNSSDLISSCSLLVSTVVTINPLPTITISEDQSICFGDSISLSVAGGTNYAWTPMGSIDDPSSNTPKVSPSITTTYYVNVTDAEGCISMDSVMVTVLPVPDLNTTNSGICSGENIDLSTLVIDDNGTTGTLSYYNNAPDAASESNAITSIVTPSSTTTYFIRKNTAAGCFDIRSVIISIVSPPSLMANDASICEGSFVDLSLHITKLNDISSFIRFYPSMMDAENETNVLLSTFVSPSTTTTYYARQNAEAPGQCFDIQPITANFTAFPNLVTTNDTICFGSAISLDTLVEDLNPTPGDVTFYSNLNDAQNATNAILQLVAPQDTTTYYVRKATSTIPPCATVDSVKIYVVSCMFDIALKKTLSVGQSTDVSPGDSVNFDITVYNQGIVTAYDVRITDYLDANSTLADPSWIPSGLNATQVIDEISVGDSVILPIQVQVNPGFMGTRLTNYAEVSYATNIDGRNINIEDEDSTPDNISGNDIGGTVNDPSQDDNITDNGTIDEDDHDGEDVNVIQTFDLALSHTFSGGEPSSYLPGEIVSLDLTVANEGTLNAYDINLISYEINGLIYLDGGWSSAGGYFEQQVPFLAAGTDETITLRYTVDPQYTLQTINNSVEISFATAVDGSGVNTMDEDSNADDMESNGLSEDDFSSLTIPVTQGFDLALRKVLSSGQATAVYPGDTVSFDIQVYNQGIEDAFDIVITDYVPLNATVVSPSWIMNGSNAEYTIASIAIGQDTTVSIDIEVGLGFTNDQMINFAELSFATDIDNSGILKDDQDSDFDTNNTDLGGMVNISGQDDEINDRGVNDEDDHDPEDVVICNIEITSKLTHPTCNGGSDGSIDITVLGGTEPFNYQWADGHGFNEDISNKAAGIYMLTVVDSNSCVAITTIELIDPDLFNFNAITSNADCGMINGSITLNITGAVPVDYDWDNDIHDGLSTLTGLTAGTYAVTATDDMGCQQDTVVSISSSSGLLIVADERDISCEGANDGFVGLTTSGGTAPYTYTWDNSAYNGLDTLEDLLPGMYALTVEDANSCTFISNFNITEPLAIAVDTAVQRLACAGDGNGIIDLEVTGGTEPYQYTWNNGLPSDPDQVGLSAGNFKYTITDANGCTYIDSVVISNPTEFLVTATTNGPVCEGETLEISATNGVSYEWEGPNGFTSSDTVLTFTNATTSLNGTYTLRSSNVNACRDTIEILAEVFPITPTAQLADSVAICNTNLGNDENVLDLNTMLIGGDMTGVWGDMDASGALMGSIFTATPSMADLTYQFTYTIAGSGIGTSDCSDRIYIVNVHVNGCGFDLSLDKSVLVSGDLGDTVTYTLTVTNNGDADAYDVRVKDHVPNGFTYDQSLNSEWTASGSDVSYTFSDSIPIGLSASVEIQLIINEFLQATSITNTAEITFATTSPGGALVSDINSTVDNFTGTVMEDDESAVTLQVTQIYDLALDLAFIEGQSPELSANDLVVYKVILTNEGSQDAYDVDLRFDYPIDLIFNGVESIGWNDLGNVAAFTVNSLSAGTSDTIEIGFNLITGSETISAEVSSEIVTGSSTSGGPQENDRDSTPGNDVAGEDDYDNLTISIDQTYDLALTITASTDSIDSGQSISIDLNITNQSTLPADDVTLVIYVPNDFEFPALVNPGWVAGTNGRYYFTFNTRIAVNDTETVSFTLTAGDNLLEGMDVVVGAEIVSGSFITGGVLLSDDDGTFDDISSNDGQPIDNATTNPTDEDNHDIISLYVRTGGCGSIVVNDIIITDEGCTGTDGSINIDIISPSNYTYTWSPDLGTIGGNGNIRNDLNAGRYDITITDTGNAFCLAQIMVDVGYACIPPRDTFHAYIPFNDVINICMDDQFINLPKSAASAVMCYDGSGTNPAAVIGSTTSDPTCIQLEAMNGFIGKFPEMLCVIHCTDDVVPICDTTLITATVIPQQDIIKVQIPAGEPTTYCLGSESLQINTAPTASSVCDPGDPSSTAVSQWDGVCVVLNPAPGYSGISMDTICLVSCYNDDPRFCDTTYVCVEVTTANCPDYFDQSLIVERGDDPSDLLDITVNARFSDFLNTYSLTNNGQPYTGNLMAANYDTLRFYPVQFFPGAGFSGPYDVERWTVDGTDYSGIVNDIFDLVDSMNVWAPLGNWTYNPIRGFIETQNLTAGFGSLFVAQVGSPQSFQIPIDSDFDPLSTVIQVPTGLNELVIPEICPDTLVVAFAAPQSSVVFDTIFVDESTQYCIDISELTTAPISVVNDCTQDSGDNATIDIIVNNECLNLEGLVIGNDTACIIICDEYGFCDTTTYHVYVRDTAVGPPIATSDTLQLFKNQFANIPILLNDDTISALTTVDIIGQPVNGNATKNPDNTIRFVPDLDYCSDVETQIIQYMICNIDGCDRGTIEIQVLCDELAVNNGFSPNGDGVNDVFYIDAALLYPNNELRVYNRWGAQVMKQKSYQNDWEGTWNGGNLPDGVYWYTFDTGEGRKLSGYVVLYRH